MAEVPEVETLVRDLREAVIGRRLQRTIVVRQEAVRYPKVGEFSEILKDRVVVGAERRAKYILLPLSDDLLLAVHLMLWGTLVLVPSAQTGAPETMIVWLMFWLSNST
jgi:formamidopyrimidine-DNA glycosylase